VIGWLDEAASNLLRYALIPKVLHSSQQRTTTKTQNFGSLISLYYSHDLDSSSDQDKLNGCNSKIKLKKNQRAVRSLGRWTR
jgi:hypothetical protein